MAAYKQRIVDNILKKKLEGMGAVLIEGPKWCGKTTTAEQQAGSVLYMNDPKRRHINIQLASMSPEILLSGKEPRLIDEWQIAPSIWDAVRFECDHRDGDGHFILTGSTVPVEDNDEQEKAFYHSGTGRICRLKMRTMSLWESGDSDGTISLRKLFTDEAMPSPAKEIDINRLAFLVCRGGWPKATLQSDRISLGRAFDYVDAVAEIDMQKVDGVKRDPQKTRRIMRSYARFQGGQVSISSIRDDVSAGDGMDLSDKTIDSYINALRKLFVVEDMPAWNPNLRSKTAIRSSDTRYFTDPSIAVASLGLGPSDLINDLRTFGLLFEVMAIRDLRAYAVALNGDVFHYRDKAGLECDAVVHLKNGKYGLVEIKLGGDQLIEDGAANLNKLESILDIDRMTRPAFKMILTGLGAYSFRRKDGVWVVPISSLKD